MRSEPPYSHLESIANRPLPHRGDEIANTFNSMVTRQYKCIQTARCSHLQAKSND